MTLDTITNSEATFAAIQANLVQTNVNEDPKWRKRIQMAELQLDLCLKVGLLEFCINLCTPRLCINCDTYHHSALICHHTLMITLDECFRGVLSFLIRGEYHLLKQQVADIENALFEKYGNFATLRNVAAVVTHYYKTKCNMKVDDIYDLTFMSEEKIQSLSVKIPNEETSEVSELRRNSTFNLPTTSQKSTTKECFTDSPTRSDAKFFGLDPNSPTQMQDIEDMLYQM